MTELCAICRRPAQGFGWCAIPFPQGGGWPTHRFCSMRHLDDWHNHVKETGEMPDIKPHEEAATRAAMQPLADYLEHIGWQTRFCDLTREQVFDLLRVAIVAYREAVAEQLCSDEIPF